MMTICQQLTDALNAAFSRKYHSLAQYILDADPYVAPGQEPALAAIKEIAAADHRFADRLADIIEQLEGVPQLALFSPEVANLNYLAVDYLAGVLASELRKDLALYETFVPMAIDVAPAAEVFNDLIETTRSQIAKL